MAKNWAIAIGINQYDFLQPLKHAQRDAQLMSDFLETQAGFEKIFFFTNDSPDIDGKSTRPYRANLMRILRQLFEQPFMQPGDNFWFFFGGHGMPHNGCDYLMPSDGDPGDVESTAISINYITQRLRRCGADNVVMILDACRKGINTRAGEGIGRQTAQEARQTGVISIFSCSPDEYSYEIEELQQGAFTYSLLQGLGIQGKCATVERLNQYLRFRVPEIVHQHQSQNARQTPYIIAEPITKSHLILIPKYATSADIATLKNDAYQAEVEKNLDLAEQLWIRVLATASGTDMDAIKAIQRIERLRINFISSPSLIVENTSVQNSPTLVSEPDFLDAATQLNPPLQPQITKASEIDDLSSERGIDYTRLRDLLKAGKWKEADQETLAVMLKVAVREQGSWLTKEDIENFACTDLLVINTLWMKYSKGHFGFSVQKRIWESLRGKPGVFNEETWFNFGERVGWRITRHHQILFVTWSYREWSYYSQINFNQDAPEGHLPRLWDEWRGGVEICSIAFRLGNCNIS